MSDEHREPHADEVENLLGQMTLEEKCAQLTAVRFEHLLRDGELDLEAARRVLAHGIGHIASIGSATLDPAQVIEGNQALQEILRTETRLAIPAIVHEEALSGVLAPGATEFPQAIGLASTWDPALVEEVGRAIGRQLRALGVSVALAPVVDIARDPRWGRLEETYGEDPELTSRLAVAYIQGVQHDGVQCCAKHFVGHGASLAGLNHGEVVTGPRRLRDVDAAPFRAAIHEADLRSVMSAYNEVDGLPCSGASEILTELLRHELAFDGCVVADYNAIDDLETFHRVAATKEEAARRALEAGLDVELPTGNYYLTLPEQVRAGHLDEAVLDTSCRRVLRQKAQLGLLDGDTRIDPLRPDSLDTADDHALARRAASRSVVLLANDGVLPLRPDLRVAVVGPSSDDARRMFGDYSHTFKREHISPFDAGADPSVLTPRQALAERFAVVDEVTAADVAVVFVGGRSGVLLSDTSGEFVDASDLRLPPEQLELIEQTAATGVPTVVVVIGGRAHSLSEVVPHAAALALAWLPGAEGARAIVDVLSGDVDAGGRLPVSLLRTVGQVGIHAAHHHGGGRSIVHHDYVDGPVSPLFAFGHGLSYTRWSYDDLAVEPGSTTGEITISIAVTNIGERHGEDVIQIYATDEVASVGVPSRRLVAFRRIAAAPHETQHHRCTLPAGRLGFHGADLRYRVEPGDVTFQVASTSATVTLTGEVVHPDPNAIAPPVWSSS